MTENNKTQTPPLSRKEFLDLSKASLAAISLGLPKFPQSGITEGHSLETPGEEIPGGVNLDLSPETKSSIEKQWAEVENKHEFDQLPDYITKVGMFLNMTRARNITGNAFIKTMTEFVRAGDKCFGVAPTITENMINKFIPAFAATRDKCLAGSVATAQYGLQTAAFVQSLVYSLYIGIDTFDHYYSSGNNFLSFTQLVPPELAYISDPEYLDYYYPTYRSQDGTLWTDGVFDVATRTPRDKMIQRKFTDLEQLSFGDTIFKDKSTGYNLGHPLVVLDAIRNAYTGELLRDRLNLFDGNMEGSMLAGVVNIQTMDAFKQVFAENTGDTFGILRSWEADNQLHLKSFFLQNVLPVGEIPAAIASGRQEIFPDFSQIPEIAGLWADFSDPIKRVKALHRIVNLGGLHVRYPDGSVGIGPRWGANFGNNYWLCNVYSSFLIRAFGINDLGHWYLDGKPAHNMGKEYSVAEMHRELNQNGRERNFIDVTHASEAERLKLLGQGYVFYVASPGHSCIILPGVNQDGETVPVLSQHGYDKPYEIPNHGYKFLNPSAFIYNASDKYQSIIWAHLLPNVPEPANPYRTPLFARQMPKFKYTDINNKEGIVSTIDSIKEMVGDSGPKDFFQTLFGNGSEKLPTGNHIFQYAFDVISIIQNYRLPVGVSPDNDPSMFVDYLKNQLVAKGYGKIVESEYAQAVFRGIEAKFVTREMSLKSGGSRPFAPIQCVGLVQLLDMARGFVDWAPAKIGGIVNPGEVPNGIINAQQIAKKLLYQPAGRDGLSVVDKQTSALHFENDYPGDLTKFKAGDTFFVAYPGEADGHTGTILTDPFTNKEGKVVVVVADANRKVDKDLDMDWNLDIFTDGMPRLRVMDYDEYAKQFLNDRQSNRIGRMVLLRPNHKK